MSKRSRSARVALAAMTMTSVATVPGVLAPAPAGAVSLDLVLTCVPDMSTSQRLPGGGTLVTTAIQDAVQGIADGGGMSFTLPITITGDATVAAGNDIHYDFTTTMPLGELASNVLTTQVEPAIPGGVTLDEFYLILGDADPRPSLINPAPVNTQFVPGSFDIASTAPLNQPPLLPTVTPSQINVALGDFNEPGGTIPNLGGGQSGYIVDATSPSFDITAGFDAHVLGATPSPSTIDFLPGTIDFNLGIRVVVSLDLGGDVTIIPGSVYQDWHCTPDDPVTPLVQTDVLPADCGAPPLFTDVLVDHPFCNDIEWMSTQGIGGGYPDGTYRPSLAVSRQAMAAFIYRLRGSPLGADPTCATAPFTDVTPAHPFCGEIDWLADSGIGGGYADGSFKGANPVSRQAMASFLYKLAGSPDGLSPTCTAAPFPDVPTTNQFCGAIDWMTTNGIAEGYADGGYHPTASVSRQAMAAFIHRFVDGGHLPA